MSKKSEFSNMCRTCMTTISNSTKQQYIHEKPSGSGADCPNIMEILLSVQPQITVKIKDNLPKKMCTRCIQQLQVAYSFLETFSYANETFHKILNDCEPSSVTAMKEKPISKEENTPAHNASDEDERNEEWFDSPYSDTSDGEWFPEDLKSKTENLKETSPTKPELSSKIENHKDVVTEKHLKGEKEDEVIPPTNEDGSISCQTCKSVLADIPQWREHMREHRTETLDKSKKKSYECEICGKVFPKITSYKLHVRRHSDERPYLCIECGKGFKVSSILSVHMKRHRGEKKIKCPQCPKHFVSTGELKGHIMAHNKERPHVCETCGKSFPTIHRLRNHVRNHGGIKQFACEHCDKRFFTAELQRRHMRTHTGEKPYRCKYCFLCFAQTNDCNRHLKQHLGKNIYQCELCPMRFPLVRDLREHFTIHNDEDEETRARNLEARAEEEKNLKVIL